MTLSAIQSEWLKTRKRPLTLWVIGILLAVVLVYPPLMAWISDFLVIDNSQGLSIWAGSLPEEAQVAAQRMRESVVLPNVIPTMLGVAASLSRVMMVILGASLAGSEFAWGTVRHLIGRTRDRLAYVSGKLIILISIILILLIIGLVVGTLSGSGITPLVRDSISWDFLNAGTFLRLPVALILGALSVLPYTLLAFMIALVTRSTAAGLAIGLVTLLVGEPILAQILASLSEPWNELAYYLPYTSSQILKTWMGSLTGGTSPDHVVRAVIVLLGYTLAFAGLALTPFRKRELTA